jgi:hypothetical protein
MPASSTPRSPLSPGRAPEIDLGSYLPHRAAAPPPVAPAGPMATRAVSSAVGAIEAAIGRLEETLAGEITALDGDGLADFAEINRRKSQSLLELTRLARALPIGGESHLAPRLKTLAAMLASDHRRLGLHLAASRQLSELMISVLHEAESDGTYGQTGPHRRT